MARMLDEFEQKEMEKETRARAAKRKKEMKKFTEEALRVGFTLQQISFMRKHFKKYSDEEDESYISPLSFFHRI